MAAKKKPTFTYPVKRLVVPDKLAKYPNGKVPVRFLRKAKIGGWFYLTAKRSLDRMAVAAKADGVQLKVVGSGYRSYARQYALFMDRYSLEDEGRVPQVTRKFDGRLYFLKKGKAPSATPGTSNHGYGLAADFNLSDPKVFAWLDKNGPAYGFYLQGKPTRVDGKPNPEFEAWHWQKVDA